MKLATTQTGQWTQSIAQSIEDNNFATFQHQIAHTPNAAVLRNVLEKAIQHDREEMLFCALEHKQAQLVRVESLLDQCVHLRRPYTQRFLLWAVAHHSEAMGCQHLQRVVGHAARTDQLALLRDNSDFIRQHFNKQWYVQATENRAWGCAEYLLEFVRDLDTWRRGLYNAAKAYNTQALQQLLSRVPVGARYGRERTMYAIAERLFDDHLDERNGLVDAVAHDMLLLLLQDKSPRDFLNHCSLSSKVRRNYQTVFDFIATIQAQRQREVLVGHIQTEPSASPPKKKI